MERATHVAKRTPPFIFPVPMEAESQLRPSAQQYREFKEHICEAHSWYKHLPLLSGRRFVVFVSPDAGLGRKVVAPTGSGRALHDCADPEFTTEHPRIHRTWNTTSEYRERFGMLDYAFELSSGYSRDAGALPDFLADLPDDFEFTLFPYVSIHFIRATGWPIHVEAIEQLRSGHPHVNRDLILELADASERFRACPRLSDDERRLVFSHQRDHGPFPETTSKNAITCYELLELRRRIAARLRSQEIAKIESALSALDEWLVNQ